MKISYAVTVCNELMEIQRLISFLVENKREEDEIVVQQDNTELDGSVYTYLTSQKIKDNIKFIQTPLNNNFGLFKNNLTETQQHIDKWGWRVNNQGWINFPDPQFRIYKNNRKIKWKNKVHEVLDGYKTISHLPTDEEWCLIHEKTIKRQETQNAYYDTL